MNSIFQPGDLLFQQGADCRKMTTKIIIYKVLDSILPVLFGAVGGVFGAKTNLIVVIPITLEEIIGVIMSSIIFAIIGGITGYYVNKFLKKIDK